MPRLQVYVPEDVAHVLSDQARSLLLGRQQYIRAILAAVAEQVKREGGNKASAGRPPGDDR